MSEFIYGSAVSLAKAIRTKEVSSREIVGACLKRIEQVNPKLNAVVQMDAESARSQARQADEALAQGHIRGPLHGVPMTIKDSLDTAAHLDRSCPRSGSPGTRTSPHVSTMNLA
jgi:amidase